VAERLTKVLLTKVLLTKVLLTKVLLVVVVVGLVAVALLVVLAAAAVVVVVVMSSQRFFQPACLPVCHSRCLPVPVSLWHLLCLCAGGAGDLLHLLVACGPYPLCWCSDTPAGW
jgi:hypothetical protein